MKRYFFIALALAVSLGCGKSDPSAAATAPRTEAASTVEPGWKEVTTSGMTISFPPEWIAVDLSKGDFDKAIQESQSSNPNNKAVMEMARQAAASGMVKLFVVDPEERSGFRRNANLVVVPAAASTIEEEVKLNKQQFEAMSKGSKVETSSMDLPAGKAGVLSSKMAGPNNLEYATRSYILHRDKEAVVFTFSSLASEVDDLAPLADKAMRTMKFQ